MSSASGPMPPAPWRRRHRRFFAGRRQRFVPGLADLDDRVDRGLAGLGHVFRGVLKVHRRPHHDAADRAVDGALLDRRNDVAERHRHRRGAEPGDRLGLERRGEDADLLALEVREVADRALRDHRGRRIHEQRDAVQPFIGAKTEHQLLDLRIGGDPLPVIHGIDQAGRRHHLEALVDADKEFRRNERALDGAELGAFDLSRNRAELARRINLGFDAAAGILLQRSGISLGEEIARIVERRQRHLHRIGLVLRLRRMKPQRRRQDNRAGSRDGSRDGNSFHERSFRLPPQYYWQSS